MTTPEDAYKYDEITVEAICAAIRLGANQETAAQAAGIGRNTLQRWLRDIPTFKDRVDQARAERVVQWLRLIEAQAVDHWQAAAWKLERTDPKTYGRRVAMEVVDADGNALDIDRIRGELASRMAAIYDEDEAGEVDSESES